MCCITGSWGLIETDFRGDSSMDEQKTPLLRQDRRWDVLLFACAAFVLFWALGERSLWASEGRWAEIVRQMFLRRDFFHPMMGAEPHFYKPLLTYWLIAAAAWTVGVLNEWTVRLPTALAGLLTIWATYHIGVRLWSVRVGRVAAWMLLSTYGLLLWSRTGTAETENLAAIVLAVAWYWARRDRPGFATFLVFYLILFTGAMTKGLTAVVVPILAVMPDVLRQRRWRVLLGPAHFAALGLAVGLYLTPFIYASLTEPRGYNNDGLAMVFQENVVRYFRPFDHREPIYIYLYEAPGLLFPWSPLWIAATLGLIRIRRSLDAHTRWLLEAAGLIFLFFTLSGSRRSYYILPILPFCTLMMAVFVIHIRDIRTRGFLKWGLGIQGGLLFGIVLLNCVSPLAAMLPEKVGFEPSPSLIVSGVMIGGLAMIINFAVERHVIRLDAAEGRPPIASSIALAVIVMGGFFCVQQTILNRVRTERPFVRSLKQRTANLNIEDIAIFRTNCPIVQFYLARPQPVQVLDSPEAVRAFLEQRPSGVLITQNRFRDELAALSADFAREPDMAEASRPWESASTRQDKWLVWLPKQHAAAKQPDTLQKEQGQ